MSLADTIEDAECLIDRPGIGRAYLVQFERAIPIGEGDEEDERVVETATSRILVLQQSGRETWTNSIDIAEELLGLQMSLF